jgi:microcystin degradation protein MlrC
LFVLQDLDDQPRAGIRGYAAGVALQAVQHQAPEAVLVVFPTSPVDAGYLDPTR